MQILYMGVIRDRAIRDTLGTRVKGPMNLIRKPRSPVLPKTTWKIDAIIREPEI